MRLHTISRSMLAAALLFGAACSSDTPTGTTAAANALLASAFNATPVGYGNLTSSYAADADGIATMWVPGPHGQGLGFNLMGGGVQDAFLGAVGFGPGEGHRGGHGPFGGGFGGGASCSTGAFNAASGRVVCDPVTRDGLTITRSIKYTTTSGTAQQAFDTLTTNTVNVQAAVSGTTTFTRDSTGHEGRRGHDGQGGPGGGNGREHEGRIAGDTTTILTASTTVDLASDRTVGGLASSSTQRTVDGASKGTENTTGTSSRGNFTASRITADTTKGVIIPIADGKPTYPTAGTITRVMQATVTYAGSAAVTSSRKEVITYDGSATAKIVITKDGVTQNCTVALPHGRPSCS